MNSKVLVYSCILIAALVACAGCTILSPTPEPTPVPTPVPAPVLTTEPTPVVTTALPTTVPTASVQPGRTQNMPSYWPLFIEVEKAGTYSKTLITHFNGGKGMSAVLLLNSTVVRPDGTVTTRTLEKPQMGQFTEIEGSDGIDRLIVTVTMTSGETFRVIDQQMQYKARN